MSHLKLRTVNVAYKFHEHTHLQENQEGRMELPRTTNEPVFVRVCREYVYSVNTFLPLQPELYAKVVC